MGQKHQDVLAPFAKGRNLNVDDVETIVQVLAEGLVGDVLHQLPMSGCDDAHVERRQAPIRTDTLDFSGLEKAKQERLHAQAHLTDFVHEDGAAVRGFEPTAFVAMRVRETALDVSEHLGFKK